MTFIANEIREHLNTQLRYLNETAAFSMSETFEMIFDFHARRDNLRFLSEQERRQRDGVTRRVHTGGGIIFVVPESSRVGVRWRFVGGRRILE